MTICIYAFVYVIIDYTFPINLFNNLFLTYFYFNEVIMLFYN